MKLKWVISMVFWIVLALSLALNERYQWIGRVWSVGLWLVVLASLMNFLTNFFRHGGARGPASGWNRGYPRWFTRFAFDEDAKNREDSKTGSPSRRP